MFDYLKTVDWSNARYTVYGGYPRCGKSWLESVVANCSDKASPFNVYG